MYHKLTFDLSPIIIDVLKFDNSYSWARSKEVFYSVKLLAPTVEPHPQPRLPPVVHIEIPREKELKPLCWHLCPSPSASSSEDEFFDCVQDQETLSLAVSLSPKQTRSKGHSRTSAPSAITLRTSRCQQIITGTSISTQV